MCIRDSNYIDFFGPLCPPIQSSVDDWVKLKRWAEDNGHELVLVSAQRKHCEDLTDEWLDEHGFDFCERHYTKHKWSVDVDFLIDDSPEKLKKFADRSVNPERLFVSNNLGTNPVKMTICVSTGCQMYVTN